MKLLELSPKGTLSKLALVLFLGILPVAACDDGNDPVTPPAEITTPRPAAETPADDKPSSPLDLDAITSTSVKDAAEHADRLVNNKSAINWPEFNGSVFLARRAIPDIIRVVDRHDQEIKRLKARPAMRQGRSGYVIGALVSGLLILLALLFDTRRKFSRHAQDNAAQLAAFKKQLEPKTEEWLFSIGHDNTFGNRVQTWLRGIADGIALLAGPRGARKELIIARGAAEAMLDELSKSVGSILDQIINAGGNTVRLALEADLADEKVINYLHRLIKDRKEIPNYSFLILSPADAKFRETIRFEKDPKTGASVNVKALDYPEQPTTTPPPAAPTP